MSRRKSHLNRRKHSGTPAHRKRDDKTRISRLHHNASLKYNCTVSSLESCRVSLLRHHLNCEYPYQNWNTVNGSVVMRRPRVLSLFDGISSGLESLRQMGVLPQVYYSSEIDSFCKRIQRFNYGSDVVQLGDIRHLDYKLLQSLGHIDLLFGGSPCNDFSAANPNRKGLHDETGTGVLFFEFLKVHLYFEQRACLYNRTHSYKWFYENVASMSSAVKEEISGYLGCQPIRLDSHSYTGMKRVRYFWTNLHVSEEEIRILQQSGSDIQRTLQDGLCGSGREAQVDCLPTFTSNLTNLAKGGHLPVIDVDQGPCYVHYSEIEKLMGFPVNFTAGPNTPLHIRKKLLAKTWDIHTIKSLLSPMTLVLSKHLY